MDFIEWIKQSWIYILAFAGILSALISFSKNLKTIKDILQKPEQLQNEKIEEQGSFIKLLKDERQQYLDNVKRWDEHEKKAYENFKGINNALIALIRDRIHGYYFRKCTEKGYITPIELEIVEELFKNYSAIGGNGMISREMETLRTLPIHD